MAEDELNILKKAAIDRLNKRVKSHRLTAEDRDALISVVSLCPTKEALMVAEKLASACSRRGVAPQEEKNMCGLLWLFYTA